MGGAGGALDMFNNLLRLKVSLSAIIENTLKTLIMYYLKVEEKLTILFLWQIDAFVLTFGRSDNIRRAENL